MSSGLVPVAPFVHEAGPARVSFGGDAPARVTEEVERLGAGRAFLVGGRGSSSALIDATAQALGERCAGVWSRVAGHVPVELAEAAVEHVRAGAGDALVALGGGSAIGMAKAVALELGLPIVAVPTTYSGSEMTPIWGLTADGVKRTGRSAAVLARAVIYDPSVTLTLPPTVSASSGMNALAHAAEALYAPGRDPISSLCALEAVRALREALPVTIQRPADLAARSRAMLGAYLAGAALAGAGTDLHHKLCHVLGGAYDLPHA
jgi:alcohol dehydrogenase class IV